MDRRDITDGMSASNLLIRDKGLSPVSYSKTDKLVSALYMVTDIMDKEEPLRIKLRTLSVNIISDLHSNFIMEIHFLHKVADKIDEIMSFLGIAETLNLISEMNSKILIKEFSELKQSIKALNPDGDLALFFKEERNENNNLSSNTKGNFIGHNKSTRIEVQKGNTLMKALSDKVPSMSNMGESLNNLKTQRREEILRIIKDSSNGSPDGVTITDINNMARNFTDKYDIKALVSCGEKTLQRELVSMVSEGVLEKMGSKRWSRYFLPKQPV